METLKIGFIGSGFIANFMVKAMEQVRHVELTAIYNRSGARQLADTAQKNGLGQSAICNSIKEVCQESDVVAILSPNHTRLQVMQEIADAVDSGVALRGVICEKPLARTLREADEMVQLAADAQLRTAYFEDQLHAPAITNALQQLKPQIKAMGGMMIARSTEEHSGPHSAWFWNPIKQGGGALSDMGCHSIAVAQHILTPPDAHPLFLEPVKVQADVSLLKWGQPKYRRQLKTRYGVDFKNKPAEDFCTGTITYRNPETNQLLKAQFTNSWMFDKQGLRISAEGLGAGYGFEVNTLQSPSEIFIGDEAAEAVADPEKALEKSTSSRGLLTIQPNEADLYGYVAELNDMRDAFLADEDAKFNWAYGRAITRLTQACYLSAEVQKTIDLTDNQTNKKLATYTSLIAQGQGGEILYPL